MTFNLAGLGDSGACGVNPCTWWDKVYSSDECLKYNACVDPTNFWVIAEQKGLVAGTIQEAISAAGVAVSAAGQEAGSAAGDTAGSAVKHLFTNPDGTTNWATVGLVGAAGLLAVAILKGR